MKKVLVDLQMACHWMGAGIGQYEHYLMRALYSLKKFSLYGVYHRTNLEGDPFPFPVKVSSVPRSYLYGASCLLKRLPIAHHVWTGVERPDISLFLDSSLPCVPIRGKVICVIHDLISLRIPDVLVRMGWMKRGGDSEFRKKLFLIKNRADVICTVSEFSRGEIANELGVDLERIKIVPPGVLASEYQMSSERDAFVKVKYHLPDRFVLYFGGLAEYKNVEALVKAYAMLSKDIRGSYPLVVVGRKDSLIKLAIEQGVGEDVHMIGFVDEIDKQSIYRLATVSAFLSRIEGFGMPVLEAMAAGVPVVSSNCASVPEAGGGAALTVAPDDLAGIKDAIESVLVDGELRERLIKGGLEWANKMTWENSAKKMAAIIDCL